MCTPATPTSLLCLNLLERYLWNFAYLLFLILRLAPETRNEQNGNVIVLFVFVGTVKIRVSCERASLWEDCYFFDANMVKRKRIERHSEAAFDGIEANAINICYTYFRFSITDFNSPKYVSDG